ncbi:branched chain amino acid aminotransferase [Arenicella chitinivorans]|uniref:Branched-chain-amino-acid aminotransferase n=1 Tax=Arenicella chitinivorans TaxID=1329800 RepID=A0A918RPD5_9GAMM|nr:branched-chain amino acid transaminase [Arenicella chitinivorans]GHA03335.1 branched chain amino acid aminotransferase [Arenicella chitinivorans]
MSFDDRDGSIWMDGEFVDWREAKVHVLTHTLHYGVGVFEGVRAYATDQGPAIFRLTRHTERLLQSAKIMGMTIPFSVDEINAAQCEIIRKNQLKSAYLRPMAFYGSEAMGLHAKGLKVHLSISAWEWGAYLGDEALENGIRVKTSSFNRHHVNSTMAKAKTNGHYTNSIMALQEAENAGYDEALMLDTNGYVAEGSGENIFIVRRGKVYTPSLTSALEGITRDTVVQLMQEDMGLEVIEKQITRDEVYTADEAFFTGTAAEVTPINSLDDRVIGSGKRGEVTTDIQRRYFDVVNGRNPDRMDWLTVV